MKTLGVIGGLGPIATAYFYELLIKMADTIRDQEHIETIIYSKPSIPDRTDYIMGRSMENPVVPMIEIGNRLVSMGADFIAIPCITAHYFHERLSREIKAPIIHLIKEIVKYLKINGVNTVGIMATEGTIYSGLFQKELMAEDIMPILPSKHHQNYVTELIYKDIKSSGPPHMEKFYGVAEELKLQGAQVIILGCTELSLIKRDYAIGPDFIDAMEVLSLCALSMSGAKVKAESDCLITGGEFAKKKAPLSILI